MLPLTPRYWFLLSCTAAFLVLSWFYLLPIIPSSTPEQIAQPPPPRPSASLASEPPPPISLPIPNQRPQEAAGNETLGFQQILTLSTARSWRTRGLQAAANLTGLQISIPPQPPISPEVIDAFISLGGPEARHPARGAGIAWLAHLDLIKHSIQLDLDTVLIIEDDVDWDIAIKSQMVGIADAVRKLTRTPELEPAPYGREWDVLWIGHCGEYWEEKWTDQTLVFDNPSVCPHDKYLGWAQPYISRLPNKQRSIYWSYNPVCSFAYALSREGARKVLHEAGHGQDEAFDVRVMGACKAKKLRCISVVPEVIHQYFPSAKFGVKSDVDIGNGEEKGPEDDAFEKVMGSTENILESARCHALWGKTCLKH